MKNILIIILLFVVYILSSIKGCDNTCPTIKDGGITYRYATDTEYVYMPVPVKVPVKIQVPTYIHDTIYLGDSTKVYKYDNAYEDDTIQGVISSLAFGELIRQEFSYKLKIPLQTIIHDSVFIDHTIIIDSTQRPRTQLGLGVSVTYPTASITPNLFLKTKNNSIFGVGYDVLNKNYQVQFIKIIKFRK